ncbi:MAG: 2,3-bisphosphoglycerate-dependent phosphoglycerate mutase [Chlamydiota bacterium]|jgi:2,3-bisphosphoglycerate-dependent phosphoglycerate mutase
MASKLILMRHGESVWNAKNLFTGWVDVPLSDNGIKEAVEGGKKIKDIPIDVIFTSSLIRAQMTAFIAMLHHESKKTPVFVHHEKKLQEWGTNYSETSSKETIPVYYSWHLNERMYGKLQGSNKDEMREKFGKEQVHTWRRSFDVAPPEGESLKMTKERTLPYFKKEVIPYLEKGENVFIAAHGNSLRSIVMFLDDLSPEEVVKLEIATGDPIVYEYTSGKWIKQT